MGDTKLKNNSKVKEVSEENMEKEEKCRKGIRRQSRNNVSESKTQGGFAKKRFCF